MSRYDDVFAAARAAGQTLVMPFLPAGFPSPAETPALMQALLDGGAGALEIGVPFSDPLADGPAIQAANTLALANGAKLQTALDAVRALRAAGATQALTLMGYLNPYLARGEARAVGQKDLAELLGMQMEAVARDAAAAGADGLIVLDLPPEESDPIRETLRRHGLALIYLLAPTSTEQRIQAVCERAEGFIYLASVTGITGARDTVAAGLGEFVERVRKHTELPLAVGFGISNRAQVESVGELCEAAAIGSALVSLVEQAAPAQRAAAAREFIEVVTGRRKESG